MPDRMEEAAAPAPRVQRPLWRRALKWTAMGLLVVLVLVGVFVGFLHTGPGQRWVRGELEDTLNDKLHAKVTLGELDFALFGDVHLGALTIHPDADPAGAPPAVELGGLDLALDWGSLAGDTIAIDELAVRHLHVRLTQRADGTTNLTGLSDEPLQLKGDKPLDLRSLLVEDVDVDVTGPDGTTHIRDLALHASAHVDPVGHTTVADLDRFSVGLDVQRADGAHIAVPTLSLTAHVEAQGPPGQQTVQARLGGVETQARVERPGQAPVDLPIRLGSVSLQADAQAIHAKLDDVQLAALTIAGVSADLGLGPDHKPAGSQRAEVKGLHLGADQVNAALGQSLLGTDVDVRFLVEGPLSRLAVEGQIDTAGGVMKLTGTADVSDPVTPRYDLLITADDVDTAKLVTQPGLPVRTSLKLSVKGAGLKPDAMNTDVRLDVGETHIGPHTIDGLVFAANAGEGAYHVRDLTLTVLGHKLTFEGDLNPGALTFRGRLTTAAHVSQLVEQVQQAGLLTVPLPDPLAGVGGDELSVDITVAGKLRPDFLTVKPADLPIGLPIAAATLTGFVRGKNLRGAGNSLGGLDLELNLAVRDAKPSGTITLGLDDLTLAPQPGQPRQHLDKTTLVMEVAGDTYTLRVDTENRRRAQRLHLVADARVDPNNQRIYATFRELDAAQGGLGARLLAPFSLDLPPGLDVARTNLVVPPIRLALAGGEVELSAAVALGPRDPVTAQPELQSMDLDVSLRHIRLAQLPAKVRRKLKGLRGTLDGTLSVQGTPQNPGVDFQLTAATNRARVHLEGGLHHRRLVLDARTALPDGTPLGELSLEAPVRLGPNPGLAPGPLHLTADARRLHLARLGDAVPPNLRDAVLTLVADIGGRTTAPDGRFKLSLTGANLGPGMEQAGLELGGRLQASAKHTALDVTAALTGAPGEPPALSIPISGTLDGSPVRGRAAPWDGALTVGPVDLAALHLPTAPGAQPVPKLDGTLTLRVQAHKARGRRAAPTATVTVEGRGLGAQGVDMAPADLTLGLTADADSTDLALGLSAGGLSLLKVQGGVPLPAARAAALAKRKRLDELPLTLRLEVPRHALAELRAAAPGVPDLPGAVGGALTLGGTAAAPTLDGALAYDGFETLAGGPGRVALATETRGEGDEAVIRAGLELGPPSPEPVRVQVELPRERALAFVRGDADDVGALVKVSARHYPLLALVPAFAAKLQGVEVAGWLSSDLSARLAASRGDDGRVVPAEPRFDGTVRVEDGRIALSALGRTFHDVGLAVALAPDGVELRGLSVREDTPDRKGRALDVSGRLGLGPGLQPRAASLDIVTDKFLAVGEPDAPEAEIDSTIHVRATLDQPIKVVDVEVAALNLYAPNRYLHDHWQRTVGMNDIVFVDAEHPVGELPTIPKPFWVGLPARPAPGSKPGGVDLHLRIPKPTRVDFFPVNLVMLGDIQVQIRDGAVWTHGGLQFPSGEAGLLGHTWKLYQGSLTLDGPVSSLQVALDFERLPVDPMRRDLSMGSTGDERGTFGLHVDLQRGLVLALGGTNGPYLGDALAEANAGRARTYTVPGLPASSTLQFPHDDEAGLVLSYLGGNLPHLLFLDRSNAWAQPDDLEGGYGKLVHFRAQKLTSDRSRRWRVVGRPPRAGRSTAELFHDWLFTRSHRSVAGFALSAGTAASLGAELFLEWSSDE